MPLRLEARGRGFGGIPRALADKPNNPLVLNEIAWLLATTDAPKLRNGTESLRCARLAVAGAPNNANYWNTLAAAHLADNDAHSALAAVDHAESLRSTGSVNDWAVSALIYINLADPARAREFHDRVAAWIATHDDVNYVVRRQHAEAAAALGK